MSRVSRVLIAAIGGCVLLASAAIAQPPAEAILPPTRLQVFMPAGGPCCGDAPYCKNWWAVGGSTHLRWQGHCGRDCNFQNDIGGGCDSGPTWLDRILGRRSCCDSCDSCESSRRVRGCSSNCTACESRGCESKGCDCKHVGCDTKPNGVSSPPVIHGDREVNPFRDDPSVLPMPTTPRTLTPNPSPARPMPPKIPEPDLNTGANPTRSVVTASFAAQPGRVPLLDRRGVPAPVRISDDLLSQPITVAKPAAAPARPATGNTLRIRAVRDVNP